MPGPSPHALIWSDVQQQYELTTGGHPEYCFRRWEQEQHKQRYPCIAPVDPFPPCLLQLHAPTWHCVSGNVPNPDTTTCPAEMS